MYKRLILLWAGSMHERVHTCSGSNRGAMHTVPLSRTNSMGRYTVSQQDLRPSLEMETASRHKPVIIYPKDMVQKHNGVRIRCTTTPSSAVDAFSTAERKLSNCQQFVCRWQFDNFSGTSWSRFANFLLVRDNFTIFERNCRLSSLVFPSALLSISFSVSPRGHTQKCLYSVFDLKVRVE